MSLLKTFRDHLVRCREKKLMIPASGNTMKYFPKSLLNDIKQIPPPNTPKRALPRPYYEEEGFLNETAFVNEYYDLVGKGSMFERKMVEEQLRALGPTSLKRSNIENSEDFDQEAADSQLYGHKLRKMKGDAESQFNMSQGLIRQILETLVTITPKAQYHPNQISPIKLYDIETSKRKSPEHSYTEIPKIPEFGEDAKLFEDYVFTLTHCTFHHKQSSKFNGIVPKILKNLFHPLNSSTIPLRTTQSFNDVIHFFSKKWNLSTCREFLVQMELEEVPQNTTTFNIMLKTLLTSKNIRHSLNPYEVALMYLKDMKKKGVDADVVTWNIMYNLFNDDISKRLILENRTMSMVPSDNYLIKALLKDISLHEAVGAREFIEIIEKFELPIDKHIINITLEKFTKERQFLPSWLITEFCSREPGLGPDVSHLNMFVAPIADMGRIDLMVATLNTFKKRFKVKPNYDSYNLIMKCISRSREWDGKLTVLRIFYHQMKKNLKNCHAGDYWIRRIRSREKFIYDKSVVLEIPLTNNEIELQTEMQNLKWAYENKARDYENQLPKEFSELASKLGYRDPNNENFNGNDKMENIEQRRQRVKEYKERIKSQSIMKSLAKRIPYAKNSYEALQREMNERGIIN